MTSISTSIQYVTAEGKLNAAGFALFRNLLSASVVDGDYGDVIVADSNTVWGLDYTAVNPVIAPVFANITATPTTLAGYGIVDAQPLDSDLTTIAGLTATTNSFLQAKASAWEARTVAQVKVDLGIAGTNTGDQTITLTGDVTGFGTGSFPATLATVNANVGSFGLAASVAQFTVNAKGLITAAANVAISITTAAISDLATAMVTLANPVITVTTFAALPAATNGRRGHISDALAAPVFNAAAVGGGTTSAPVWADGTVWRYG